MENPALTSTPPSGPPAPTASEPASAPVFTPYQRARILLISAAILCFCAFWWGGRLFRIPIHPGYEASLLQQPQVPLVLIMVGAALAGCVAIGTAVAGMIRFNAGLLTAAIGLFALSTRGGTSRDVMHHALATGNSQRVFVGLATESGILAALLGLLWLLLLHFHRGGVLRDREGTGVMREGGHVALSLLLQVLATGLFMYGVCASDAKQQVMAAVVFSSFCGCATAQAIFPTTPRGATWLPPLLVGVIGYLLAHFNPEGISIAHLTHWSAPLSRPLPLDYAGLGVAGAIVGHWVSRQWARQGEDFFSKGSEVAGAIARRV